MERKQESKKVIYVTSWCVSMIPDYRNDWSLYRETWRWAALLILRRTYFRIHGGLSVASCASSKDTQPHALSSNTGTRLISSGEEATAAIAENEIRITAYRCASIARINGSRIRRSHLNDFQRRGFQDYLRGEYDIMKRYGERRGEGRDTFCLEKRKIQAIWLFIKRAIRRDRKI